MALKQDKTNRSYGEFHTYFIGILLRNLYYNLLGLGTEKLRMSKLEKFMAKRVFVIYIVLVVLNFMFIDQRWVVFIGLTIGSLYSLLRLQSTAGLLAGKLSLKNGQAESNKSMVRYVMIQCGTFLVLVAAVSYHILLFAGIVVGILLVPFVIMVNSISEAVGLTHNTFE